MAPPPVPFPNVAVKLAQDPMRKAQTETLTVFYPQQHRDAALRYAAQLEGCVQRLRAALPSNASTERVAVTVTSADFENAYVFPGALGARLSMMLPLQLRTEAFNHYNLGVTDVGAVACHEAVHYVMEQQLSGFGRTWRRALGDIIPPMLWLDKWFVEGLAVYYETSHAQSIGRLASPLWRGRMQAVLHARPEGLRYDDLSPHNRALNYAGGGFYLIGSHFVEYLATRYGEPKLWDLVQDHGEVFWSSMLVAQRFKAVYRRDLVDLFAEFNAAMQERYTARERPLAQTTWAPPAGESARLATCPAGRLTAVAQEGLDALPTLTLLREDGSVLWSRNTVGLWDAHGPNRARVTAMSGISFTRACDRLFVAASQPTQDQSLVTVLFAFDTHTGKPTRLGEPLQGMGGGIDAAGQRYAYVHIQGGVAKLAWRDLVTGEDVILDIDAEATSLGAPAFSPDGQSLAFAARTPQGFNILVRNAQGAVTALTDDAQFNYGPRWRDDGHLIFMRGVDGRSQAVEVEMASGTLRQLTDAPYAVLDPAPLQDNRIVFLNAEDRRWTLDAVEPSADTAGWGITLRGDALASAEACPDAECITDVAPDAGQPTKLFMPTDSSATLELADMGTYSGLDGLWPPTVRVPFFSLRGSQDRREPSQFVLGLSVAGQDRLAWHNYLATASYNTTLRVPAFNLIYRNDRFQPYSFAARMALQNSFLSQEWIADLSAERKWTDVAVKLGLSSLRIRQRQSGPGTWTASSKVVGPSLALTYKRGTGTLYGGVRRAVSASTRAAWYPQAMNSSSITVTGYPWWLKTSGTVTDVGAILGGVLPVPGTQRHAVGAQASARALLGDPTWRLVVGGSPPVRSDALSGTHVLVDGLTADMGFATRVAVGQVDYRYKLVIDRGTTPRTWLPSVYASEVDFKVFANMVLMDGVLVEATRFAGTAKRRTVGVQAALQATLGDWFPLGVSVGAAYGPDDGHRVTPFVFLNGAPLG